MLPHHAERELKLTAERMLCSGVYVVCSVFWVGRRGVLLMVYGNLYCGGVASREKRDGDGRLCSKKKVGGSDGFSIPFHSEDQS